MTSHRKCEGVWQGFRAQAKGEAALTLRMRTSEQKRLCHHERGSGIHINNPQNAAGYQDVGRETAALSALAAHEDYNAIVSYCERGNKG